MVTSSRRRYSFAGRCAVITGGSRGLGLVMARQLARQGARLVLIARNADDVARAERELRGLGADVLAVPCDVRRQEEVNAAIEKAVARFGNVDVLINNAGIIQVGPLEHMTVKDFEDALAIHFWGPLYCILAALPHMRRAGGGHIVNISSVGGKIAVPHLLPYCASKFALVGLSDGLRAELRRHGIFVTTVCPGLMRTGSPRNALFKGKHRLEYAWFAISDSLPVLSVSAAQAGERILNACRRGAARLTIGIHIKGAVLFNELFPETMSTLLSLGNRLLPGPAAHASDRAHAGFESQSALAPAWLTRLTEEAARRNNEMRIGLESKV
ncbi:MAG TPA: SDR family oxidoreductase [Candidatus Acidoferrum sp.]|nr:SDR family oxidoreductase [Candidatus Acidoferrum sp.]